MPRLLTQKYRDVNNTTASLENSIDVVERLMVKHSDIEIRNAYNKLKQGYLILLSVMEKNMYEPETAGGK